MRKTQGEPMEALAVLERKVTELLLMVNQLKKEKNALARENEALKKQVTELENAVLATSDEQQQETAVTKAMVDGLIKDIDAIVSQ